MDHTIPEPAADEKAISLSAACPNCQVRPGQPCTQPTSTGRRPVTRFHYGRYAAGLVGIGRQRKG